MQSKKKKEWRKTCLGTNESTKSEGRELTSVSATLIQMTNVDLDGGVILGSDQPVSGRAASNQMIHN